MTASFVIDPPPQAAIAVQGETATFPVRRVWCVGRNYLEHIRELGNDERNPPFFFAKHADMAVADGSVIPYPTLTKDMQHEVELVRGRGARVFVDHPTKRIELAFVQILTTDERKTDGPWIDGRGRRLRTTDATAVAIRVSEAIPVCARRLHATDEHSRRPIGGGRNRH